MNFTERITQSLRVDHESSQWKMNYVGNIYLTTMLPSPMKKMDHFPSSHFLQMGYLSSCLLLEKCIDSSDYDLKNNAFSWKRVLANGVITIFASAVASGVTFRDFIVSFCLLGRCFIRKIKPESSWKSNLVGRFHTFRTDNRQRIFEKYVEQY